VLRIRLKDNSWKLVNRVPDVVAPDAQLLQGDGVSVLEGHLDRLEVRVHGHVHARDGPVHLGAVLQLDRHALVRELHQKAEK
jgi:hypothetical protein